MHPSGISIQDYTYHLPDEKIANFPLEKRDISKLLIYQQGRITEDIYSNIAAFIPASSLILFNNSKVIQARILFRKDSGAHIEIFCLEPAPAYKDISTAMAATGKAVWKCLIGGASKWKHGLILEKKIIAGSQPVNFQASIKEKLQDSFIIEFSWNREGISFADILHHAGTTPLPPYIKREAKPDDMERYQTVYADAEGSVAAPTAGLHFTDAVLFALSQKNIETDFVTLHVGAGTFRPVKADTMKDHEMHAEFIDVSLNTISHILQFHHKHITAVGTTSLRTIESLYWIGVKILQGQEIEREGIALDQWEPYEISAENISAAQALGALMDWMKKNELSRLITKTRLLIAPGYQFRLVSALVTNFHQPQSTLLLLVAAFVGQHWRKIYDHALAHEFRFLSYGDGCLLFRQ
jgi:S-adenosylmethionine:tRNA ribosyltransferase-isomerase